ncbi:MAG: hypothetical protein ACRDKV_01000 [Solirubrobacterales bacterium]
MTALKRSRRQGQLGVLLAVTAAIVAAIWVGAGVEWAIPSAMVMLGFIALLVFGVGRSDTAEVIYGVGDERVRQLHLRACAAAGVAMLAVIVLWYLVTVAMGDPNETLGVLATLFNGSLITAAVTLSRRG